mgnify:CR=1 FL=1
MPNEPHQRNYLHGSFETPSTIPPTNPTKTKPLTPKESKSLCLTNMLRSNAGGQGDKERPGREPFTSRPFKIDKIGSFRKARFL